MAGIGFELRKILKQDTLARSAAAFGMAGIISSGPWIVSILGILFLGIVVSDHSIYHRAVTQFQISITYLIAISLVISGFAQHSFTRYVSDQLFTNNVAKVIPNLNGLTCLLTGVAGFLALICSIWLFPEQSMLFRFTLIGCFVVLCNIWIATNLLAGVRDYTLIMNSYVVGYALTVGLGYVLRYLGVDGLMLGFLLGQLALLMMMYIAIYKQYPSNYLIEFDFLRPKKIFYSLIFTGFFYNLGIWIDKFIFWFFPTTSQALIGPFRNSVIYDVPIFMAYLALIPGMAIFLMRIETDFADYNGRFYDAIRNGQTLNHIQVMRSRMTSYAQSALYEIMKVQTLTVIAIFLTGERILIFMHISPIYKSLLFIDVIGASLQIVLLAIINMLFYLDKRKQTLSLCILFTLLNLGFSIATVYAGPFYYGFGFTFALMVTCSYGMYVLNNAFTDLEYKSIMLF